MKNFGKFFLFFGSKFAENKVDVGNFAICRIASFKVGAETRSIICTKSKPWEILGVKMCDSGFQSIVAAGGTVSAETEFAEVEIEIVTDN